MRPNKIKWRDQYVRDDEEAHGKAAAWVPFVDERDAFPDGAQQQHKEDTDLNVIMKRYGVTDGAIPAAAWPEAVAHLDLSEMDGLDLRTVLDRTNAAKEAFMQLPADLRSRFHNDPARMWEWVNNPKNADQAVDLGLLSRLPSATGSTTGTATSSSTTAPTASAPATTDVTSAGSSAATATGPAK